MRKREGNGEALNSSANENTYVTLQELFVQHHNISQMNSNQQPDLSLSLASHFNMCFITFNGSQQPVLLFKYRNIFYLFATIIQSNDIWLILDTVLWTHLDQY